MNKRYRPAIFAVVYKRSGNKTLYLLLKRKLHWTGWEFPKGGIEKGEKEIGAVKREIKEETSLKILKITNYRIKGRYTYNRVCKRDRPGFVGQTYSLYSAEVGEGKIKFDKIEHSAFKWVEFDKALRMLKWPSQRKCLRIVEKSLKHF